MNLFFYSRISTTGQNVSRQIATFKKIPGFDSKNLFVDKIQGNVPFLQRPEAVKLFDAITEIEGQDVTVVIDSIDRLGRNLMDILSTMELFKNNGINVQSVKEGFQTIINGKINPITQVVVSVMGSIAEMERDRIKERTREGIAIAKASGKFKGRKLGSTQTDTKLMERHPIIIAKLKKGLSYRDIAEITGKSTATIAKVKKVLEKRSVI